MTSRLPIGTYLRLNTTKGERRKDHFGIVTSSPDRIAVKVGETVRGHAVYEVRRRKSA